MDHFKYKPIHHLEYAFRLVLLRAGTPLDLDIHCELIYAVLDDEAIIPYGALSYTWGDEHPLREIWLDGCRMPVRSGLHSALERLRLPDRDRVLWIDAICINQQNDAEKTHQVQQMREIYEKAEEVIIWLGGLTYTSSTFLRCLKEFENRLNNSQLMKRVEYEWLLIWKCAQQHVFSEMETTCHLDFTQELDEGLGAVLDHPWFRRGWIIQEVANARRAVVQCDSVSFSSKTFGLLPSISKGSEQLLQSESSSHLHSIFELMAGPRKRPRWWTLDRTLYTLVHKFSHAETSISRDRVYALLGMRSDIALDRSKSRIEVVPDYEAPESSVIRWTIAEMYDCPLDIIPEGITSSVAELCSSLATIEDIVVYELLKSAETSSVAKLLKRRESVTRVSEDMMRAAIQNKTHGIRMLELLISHRNSAIVWDEATFTALCVNQPHAHKIIEPKMFKHPGIRWSTMLLVCLRLQSLTTVIHVLGSPHCHTQKALWVWVSRCERDKCVMLPSRLNAHTRAEILCAAASNEKHSEPLVKLLLSHKSNYREITQLVVNQAARHAATGSRTLRVLLTSALPLQKSSVVDGAALCVAASDPIEGPAMIAKLLQACDDNVQTESDTIRSALQAAHNNKILGKEVKKEIWKHCRHLTPLNRTVLEGNITQSFTPIRTPRILGCQDVKVRKRPLADFDHESGGGNKHEGAKRR